MARGMATGTVVRTRGTSARDRTRSTRAAAVAAGRRVTGRCGSPGTRTGATGTTRTTTWTVAARGTRAREVAGALAAGTRPGPTGCWATTATHSAIPPPARPVP